VKEEFCFVFCFILCNGTTDDSANVTGIIVTTTSPTTSLENDYSSGITAKTNDKELGKLASNAMEG
jgi:hypothetical protein